MDTIVNNFSWKVAGDRRVSILIIIHSISILLITFSSWKICIYEPPSYTKGEISAIQLTELNKMIKRGDKMLADSENKTDDQAIILEDSTAIINYFSHFLDSAFYNHSDSIKIAYSSTFYYFFNRLLISQPYGKVEMISDSIETNKYRQIIKHNLSIDFFSYSPDQRKLFIIMTYEVGEDPKEANALAMLGERDEEKIILYRCPRFRNDYGVVNKKYAFYQIISDFEDSENPLKTSFWDGYWYKKVRFNNTEKYRYQLDDFAYKWNEKKQFNERVTAEIETFIVIEK